MLQAGQQAPIWPTNVPVYDLQTQAPFLFEKSNPVFEGYKNLRQENPERFAELLQSETVELPPPREGASKILQWEVNLVSKSIMLHLDCLLVATTSGCITYAPFPPHLTPTHRLTPQA